MPDPFEQLRSPVEAVPTRDSFRRALRRRVVEALGVDPSDITVDPFRRSTTMETTNTMTTEQRAASVGARTTLDGIWPVVVYDDPHEAMRFLVDVLGFDEKIVVTDPSDPTEIVHSEFRWPEGGIVQVAGRSDNVHTREIHGGAMYVITQDPDAVLARCVAAGSEIVVPMHEVAYDIPGSKGFSVRDPGGVVWSFGHYGLAR